MLEQDYPNIEYIVVDGGSTDGSADIIRRYADRLAWWVSEKDNGQTDAINKGFARATGQILAWINSDDTYRPGALAAAARYLMEQPLSYETHSVMVNTFNDAVKGHPRPRLMQGFQGCCRYLFTKDAPRDIRTSSRFACRVQTYRTIAGI